MREELFFLSLLLLFLFFSSSASLPHSGNKWKEKRMKEKEGKKRVESEFFYGPSLCIHSVTFFSSICIFSPFSLSFSLTLSLFLSLPSFFLTLYLLLSLHNHFLTVKLKLKGRKSWKGRKGWKVSFTENRTQKVFVTRKFWSLIFFFPRIPWMTLLLLIP